MSLRVRLLAHACVFDKIEMRKTNNHVTQKPNLHFVILPFIDELQEPHVEKKGKMPKQKVKRPSSNSQSTHEVIAHLQSKIIQNGQNQKPIPSSIQLLVKIFPNIFPERLEMYLKHNKGDLMYTIKYIKGLMKDAALLLHPSGFSSLTNSSFFNNPHHHQRHPTQPTYTIFPPFHNTHFIPFPLRAPTFTRTKVITSIHDEKNENGNEGKAKETIHE